MFPASIKSYADLKSYYQKAKQRKLKRLAKRKDLALRIDSWRLWRDKCDAVWSEAVKILGKKNGITICPTCGINRPDTACHKVPRRHLATRWLLNNGYFGCRGCNLDEKMNRGIRWDRKLDIAFGSSAMANLRVIAELGESKFSVDELKEIYNKIKKVIETALTSQ